MSTRTFQRGARPSPRHKLLAAPPHRPTGAAPAQFAVVPPRLSVWLNDQYGDCVTAEEAYAKAAWSVMNDTPELVIPDAEVKRWAEANGFLDGATLTDVMDAMARSGFVVGAQKYGDGPYAAVDYADEQALQSAIATGPVKIGIDASAMPSTAGNGNGWYATGGAPEQFPNMDHCVGLTGYGTAAYLYQQLGVPVPSGISPTATGYLLFTWGSIGFVDHAWLMSCCGEAWVRNPTTPATNPPVPTPPTPPPPPPPPTPNPATFTSLTVTAPMGFLGRMVTETFNGSGSVSGGAAVFTAGATAPVAVNWNQLVADLTAALPVIEQLLVTLTPLLRSRAGAVNWQAVLTVLAQLLATLGPLLGN